MNYENEFCRKVYDHHAILKNEITLVLMEQLKKLNVQHDAAVAVALAAQSAVDASSNKLTSDFQRTFAKM